MIKATMRDSQGRVLLILGLSELNLQRLRQNQPIAFDIAEMDIEPDEPIREVIIVWGRTEEAISADFIKHYLIGNDTKIVQDPKLFGEPRTPGTPAPDLPGAYFTIDTQCPTCGHRINAAGDPNNPEVRAPVPGDATVCMGCGAFLRFIDGLDLRALTDEEVAALVGEERAAYDVMRETIRQAKAKAARAHLDKQGGDATVFNEHGQALPLGPAAARSYMEQLMDRGELVAVLLDVDGQLSLQVRGLP